MRAKPYYSDAWVTIYHDDCREILAAGHIAYPHLNKCGLVIADYPFNAPDQLAENTADMAQWLLNEGGNFLVINNPYNLFKQASYYQDFRLRNGLALVKTQAFCPAWHLGFRHNYALLLCKGDFTVRWNGSRQNNIHDGDDVIEEWHAGYKNLPPEAIPWAWAYKFILLLTNPGDLVIDFFTGAGSFAVACKQLQGAISGWTLMRAIVGWLLTAAGKKC